MIYDRVGEMGKISQRKHYQTKEDYVHDILRESILNCDYEPGEKLVIDRLSEELEISTIPIRASIQRLGMEGLVIVKPHSPAQVSPITINMIQETLTPTGPGICIRGPFSTHCKFWADARIFFNQMFDLF